MGTATAPPKDRQILRSAELELRAADGDGMPTLVGYMLRFNEWTEIDSLFEGHFLERIVPGAAKKTLAESRDQIRILFNHGMDPTIGKKPLTNPDLREDAKGVLYEGVMFDTLYNRELVPALESKQLGSSIKFRALAEEWEEEPEPSDENPRGIPERSIKEIQLYEGGPVTFPAYEGATAGVRSLTDLYIVEFGAQPEGMERMFSGFAERHPERAAELLASAERVNQELPAKKSPSPKKGEPGYTPKQALPAGAEPAHSKGSRAMETPIGARGSKRALEQRL
jgi:HK97 family phage prohead protease